MKQTLYVFAACLMLLGCSTLMNGKTAPKEPLSSGPQAPGMVGAPAAVESTGVIPPLTPQVKVALLVPLSGPSASIGNSMVDAATMALYDYYLTLPSENVRSQVILMPKDAGDTPAAAAAAAKQAIADGATFLVGPLFSQSVSAVAPIAAEKNISMLSFSNNRAVATHSVFTFGFLPEQQIIRMADYAFLHGYQRVAMLAPNDAYGEKIQETLVNAYLQKGGSVAPAELYAPSPANIDAAVGRLAAYNNANQERRFQAIFVADGGTQLKNIISSLKKTNIDLKKIRLLGTGLWDDPAIAKIPEMNGAWFSSSPPEAYSRFEARFMNTYNYKPLRLASLSYDAVTIVAEAVTPSVGGVNTATLTDPAGFNSPANGMVRLLADGTSDRKLSIMEITPLGFKTIDAAAINF